MPKRSQTTAHVKSHLDRPIDWTEFPNQWAMSKEQRCCSFRQLAKLILLARGMTKADLLWLKLAIFGEERTDANCLRHNANMLAINGVELDFDAGDVTWDQALARLYEAGLFAILYTTRRHREDRHRFRILLLTSTPLPPSDRERLAAWAYGVVGGTIDDASFNDSQAFYYGSTRDTHVRVELLDPPGGRCVDEALDLAAGALGRGGKPYNERPRRKAVDWDEDDGLGPELDPKWIASLLAAIPPDKHHEWVTCGMAIHDAYNGDEAGYELWTEWSQTTSRGNFADESQGKAWGSFQSDRVGARVTLGTLVHMAKAHGWKPQSVAASFGELRLLSTEECTQAPQRGYVWKSILAPGNIGSIYGAPGAGKSLIAPHISMQVALGEDAFGLRTKPGNVLYVAVEDPNGMQGRISALARRQGHAKRFKLVDGVSNLFAEGSSDVVALLEVIQEHCPTLIVIDTLADAFPGLEENDAKSMGRVVAIARQFAKQGAAVVLVHHDTKAEGATPRGHSILNGALDMALHIKRDAEGIVRGILRKNRNGTCERDIAFRIGIEDLGVDEDGDPVTSALVEELLGVGQSDHVRLTGSEQAALAKLIELEAEGRVAEDEWRAACVAERRVSGSEDVENRKRAMRRAVQGLAKKSLIDTRDGFVATCHEVTSGSE